ncbi:MAG: serine protease [Chloroflexota bacterium]|nr:serine protease [Chloroflexota bacterium]
MYSSVRPRRSHIVPQAIAFLALVIVLLFSATPSQAKPSTNPDTIVSSDGFIPAASSEGVIQGQGETYVLPSKGSGALKNGGQGRANDAHVAPAPVPGEASPESVIGTDSRFRITSTTSYPYGAIAHITSSIGGCTGWLINANTVVTAGHCVFGSGWATNVRVYPGRNGSSTPYGSCGASRLFSVTGWTSSKNRNYDYGAIKLNCSIGNSTGSFGYRWTSASLTGQASYTSGYPGDKTYGTQWRSNDSIRISQTYRLYYANDTFGGQSGSPVWNGGASCSPCGIAIHAYGVDSTGYNGGTRITQSVFNNLTTWKNS